MIMVDTDEEGLLSSDFITPSELRVLKFTAKGYSSEEIAHKLFLSRHTINNHKKNMIKRTKSRSMSEVLNKAQLRGLI